MEEKLPKRDDNEIHNKLDALIGMLTIHVSSTAEDIKKLQDAINDYFKELDAKTHVHHHEYVEQEITDEDTSKKWWDGVKKGLVEKAILFVVGVAALYLSQTIWEDFRGHVQQPSIQQQVKEPKNAN